MKTIFSMIRFMIRAIWSLFWGLFWTLALSFALMVGILFFSGKTGKGMDGVSRAVETVVNQVEAYLNRDGSFDSPSDQTAQDGVTTDGHTATGARWDQPKATVYIDPTIDRAFVRAYQEAVKAWNQTGAFTFQFVKTEEEADVILTQMDDATVSAAGEAESQTNVLTNRFQKVTVRLNRHYLLSWKYGYSNQRIVNTAEHELGHAIGLDHNEEESVMQSAGSFYSIQEMDIQAVRQLYKE